MECNKQNPGPRETTEFIQLIDLILGCARQSLDYTSKKQWQVKTAQVLRPLFAATVENDRRKEKFRYAAYNRCSISFFPSKKLSVTQLDDEYLRAQSSFYKNRRLDLTPGTGDSQQLTMEL